MILSMTGFGRAVKQVSDKKITVEIKSLNSKQLDLQMRTPPFLREAEIPMRNIVASSLQRGKVDLSVAVEWLGSDGPLSVNTEALKGYKAQIEMASKELGLPEPADWYSVLMRLPDVFKSDVNANEGDVEALLAACTEACDNLTNARKIEGEKLDSFFREKIGNLGQLLAEVDPYEHGRVQKIRERLEDQLKKLDSVVYDQGRLEQELIFYIEKLDVTEEKTRLHAHLKYFIETLDGAEGQGKKLGFILQEIGREINTLGSKSNDADMQRIVVKMKDELEQMKEQVLNIL